MVTESGFISTTCSPRWPSQLGRSTIFSLVQPLLRDRGSHRLRSVHDYDAMSRHQHQIDEWHTGYHACVIFIRHTSACNYKTYVRPTANGATARPDGRESS